MQYSVVFPGGEVRYLFDIPFKSLDDLVKEEDCVIITDAEIAALYGGLLARYKTVVIPAGEEQKNWQIVESIAEELLEHEAHRKTFLVGVGGGVITDITGFIATVYMRGIRFGFVPTSLLAMVDASIGGKNGVNMGKQKNFLGSVQQPEFILYDLHFLDTLPGIEWSNGFAEIIKYACIFDKMLFEDLKQHKIDYYRTNRNALLELIQKCAGWKNKIVLEDERETGPRKLLNFGHTAGHAFETIYNIPHGHGVALGMIVACIISEANCNLQINVKAELAAVLQQYELPVYINFDVKDVMDVLRMDKKRNGNHVDYIVLSEIGKAEIKALPFDAIEKALLSFSDVSNH